MVVSYLTNTKADLQQFKFPQIEEALYPHFQNAENKEEWGSNQTLPFVYNDSGSSQKSELFPLELSSVSFSLFPAISHYFYV